MFNSQIWPLAPILFLAITSISGEDFELYAEVSQAKLPTPREGTYCVYDGRDKIYVMGGGHQPDGESKYKAVSEMVIYTLSTDTVQVHNTNYNISGGYMIKNDNEIMYYLGGFNGEENQTAIMKYSKEHYKWTKVGELPNTPPCAGIFRTGQRYVFLFDAYKQNQTLLIDLKKIFVRWVDNLYISDDVECMSATATGDLSAVVVYWTSDEEKPFKALRFYSKDYQKPMRFLAEIPRLEDSRLEWDGNFVYIIGGGRTFYSSNPGGLVQLHHVFGTWTSLPIRNFPFAINKHQTIIRHSTVYIDKFRRIYVFGGKVYDNVKKLWISTDKIWWVNLDPYRRRYEPTTDYPDSSTTESVPQTTDKSAPPSIFNCTKKTKGMYPHYIHCDMFVGCRNGIATEYTCPQPLLFHPGQKTCTFPSFVQCGIHCSGKEDGLHPHPYDCAKFLTCDMGTIAVYNCFPDSLFDPIARRCNFPHLVKCAVKLIL